MSDPQQPNQHDLLLEKELNETSHRGNHAIYLALFVSLIQLISVGAYMWNETAKRSEENKYHYAQQKYEMLEKQYDRQDKKYQQIEYPMIAIRANLEEREKICAKPLSAVSKQKLTNVLEQLNKNKIALIQAYGGSQLAFGEEPFNNIKNFLVELEKDQAIFSSTSCSNLARPSSYWLQKGRIINDSMFNSMIKTIEEIKKTIKHQ